MWQIDYSKWDGLNALKSFMVKNSWKADSVDWYKKLLQEVYDAGKMPAKYKISEVVVVPSTAPSVIPGESASSYINPDMVKMQPETYATQQKKEEPKDFVQVDEYTKVYPEGKKFTPVVPKVEGATTISVPTTAERARNKINQIDDNLKSINAQIEQHVKNGENSSKIMDPLYKESAKLLSEKKKITDAHSKLGTQEQFRPLANFVRENLPGIAQLFNL